MIALLVITVVSLAVAVVMGVVAWRLTLEERRRAQARVAVLAADIHDEKASPVHVSDLFVAEARPRTNESLFSALAIGALVVGSLIALTVVFTGGPRISQAAAPTDAERAAPLELIALGHERDGDDLIVRGVVRNPDSPGQAGAVGLVTAVVVAFNQEGGLVASGHAPLDSARLASGVESNFAVRITGVGNVYRYRVSFRVDDRAIAHVDRRDHVVTARLP